MEGHRKLTKAARLMKPVRNVEKQCNCVTAHPRLIGNSEFGYLKSRNAKNELPRILAISPEWTIDRLKMEVAKPKMRGEELEKRDRKR